jgi:hypothetical protein
VAQPLGKEALASRTTYPPGILSARHGAGKRRLVMMRMLSRMKRPDQQRDRNNIRRETVLDIKGESIPGNQHDILTGSDPDGRAFIDGYDHTCNNWTTDAMTYPQANPNVAADRARAMLGHSDRGGQNTSWITSHLSQRCSKQALINTGGAGHLYCFATN